MSFARADGYTRPGGKGGAVSSIVHPNENTATRVYWEVAVNNQDINVW